MHLINHLLFAVCISLGFFIFFNLSLKKKTLIFLIFLIGGLAFGMYEHMAQDEVFYSRESYMNYCVYLKEHPKTTFKEAICDIFYNRLNICKS